ncbi:MAG: hypothetical protein ABR502_06830 [Chitinophagaceae bacterium]
MKKLISVSLFLMLFGFASTAIAQDQSAGQEVKSGAKKAGKTVKKGAKKAGNKTAEVATKSKAKVTHTVYKGKTGPNNETIYINTRGRYYWIDKKGRKHYIPASALKNKVD